MSRVELDARRLLCPMPVIRTQDRIATMNLGEELVVYATDPGAINDITSWCRINGHEVIEASNNDGDVRMLLRVGEG